MLPRNKVLVSVVSFFIFAPGVAQAINYTFLAPLPGFGSTELVPYLISLVRFLIGVAGVFAVIQLVRCGFELLTSPGASQREHAKECIWKVVLGLLLILSAYVLLESINPELNKPKLDLPETGQIEGGREQPTAAGWYFSYRAARTGNEVYSTKYADQAACQAGQASKAAEGVEIIKGCYQVVAEAPEPSGCPTCVPLAPEVISKPPGNGCAAPGPCMIGAAMKAKLAALRSRLGDAWWVTESYPPTRQHRDSCHEAGTCVDADYSDNRTGAADIVNFIVAARSSGLTAVYEVGTVAEYNRLLPAIRAAGLPSGSLINVGTWITGSHFSVYDR